MPWWEALGILRQVMFVIGCCAGGILVIQIIMTLIGLGHDTSFDGGVDFDGDADADGMTDGGAGMFGMKLLSMRAVIAFLGIGSWVCYILADPAIGCPIGATIPVSIAAGAVAALLMAWAMFSIEKLQSSGNVTIENAVGKIGDVYLRIAASKSAAGKIQITIQERLRDYDAFTEAGREIHMGEKVKVVGVIDDTTLLVEPF